MRLTLLTALVYTFKHVLTQEVAYQSLVRRVRQQSHAHIAQVLEEQFPEVAEVQPELLAYHYTRRSEVHKPSHIGNALASALLSARPTMKRSVTSQKGWSCSRASRRRLSTPSKNSPCNLPLARRSG